ncbi:glycosyltransferase family 4 protein [Bradyrhizobium sp. 21]|uniref:glycosyltransferase family 4 protein n=1 Tax=Bradyrhizobium sp. 21 TaxID=2782666 RepID=UPI001FFB5873|nr:glycosyltransferase family 4 protein [Bradyrhizobium sp. 21]MCK1384095.1 glycosyltransferase family 4 protein [Bradyrhizobium sp. 21]
MREPRCTEPQVIVPNLHWHYSGVTATSQALLPIIGRMINTAWFGPDAPAGASRLGLAALLRLRAKRGLVVWHARRNNDMIVGVLLKSLGWPLRLVFTSAAQRKHSRMTRWLISRMDAVISTSQISASYLARQCTVIHHGVDPENYKPADDRAVAYAETGLPGRYAIGCFGRVRKQKGTDIFVDAMCSLLPRYPEFSAVVVGAIAADEAGFAAELKARIADAHLQSRIVLCGNLSTEEVRRWYQRIVIFAFTSRNDGFGITLIEAMAAGAAVVASRAGAAEIVIENGSLGILVPAGDAQALGSAIETLMQDPVARAAMGARGRTHVVSKFSLDAEASRIVEVYRLLLASPGVCEAEGYAESSR